jgi:hypothetical protein
MHVSSSSLFMTNAGLARRHTDKDNGLPGPEAATEDCTQQLLFEGVRGFTKSSNRFGAMETPNTKKVLEVVTQ